MGTKSSCQIYQPPHRETCQRTAGIYRAALRAASAGIRSDTGRLSGCWADRPEMSLVDLHSLVRESLARSDAEIIKQTGRITVTHTHLEGADIIIKQYQLSGALEKIKYLFHHSRARRFWAAACTLRELGIPTPKPFGFLECWKHGIPATSYIITGFIPDTHDASKWLGWTSQTQPEDLKQALASDLAAAMTDLYRQGIYHRDTKTSNLLIEQPLNPEQRRFLWLDLECLACGVRPSRRKIIRNVVQVVGSLGPEATCADREQVVGSFANIFPWLTHANILCRIHCWADRRMHKERRCC